MGRLIDADKLKEMLEDEFCADCKECARKPCRHNDIQDLIDNIPTAYNVDAVVAELGNIKVKHSYNPIKDEIMYKGIDLEEVTSIVRKGGVE